MFVRPSSRCMAMAGKTRRLAEGRRLTPERFPDERVLQKVIKMWPRVGPLSVFREVHEQRMSGGGGVLMDDVSFTFWTL